MASTRLRRGAGIVLIVLGSIVAAYSAFGIYLFFVITGLLPFADPVYSSLALLGASLIASLAAAYLGFRMLTRR